MIRDAIGLIIILVGFYWLTVFAFSL